jgi:hypothetical protein
MKKFNGNICDICKKNYKSYQSLWNHNNKFHKKDDNTYIIPDNTYIIPDNTLSLIDKKSLETKYECDNCNRYFNNYQNRWKHIKKCKNRNNSDLESDKLKLEILKKEAEILELQLKLKETNNNDTFTIKKINKLLKKSKNKINNSFNNNCNNTTNIVNNFNLIGFGKENSIQETLTLQEKKIIMNAKFCSLEKLIEIVHCGNYNQFKNIIITNIKDNYMYKYDEQKGDFIIASKNEILNNLINYRLYDLEVIYNDFLEKNKLDNKTKECIKNFINKINNNDNKYIDIDGKEHENFKQYKISEIKILLFNNQEKIKNDISLLLSTSEINSNDYIIV